MSVIENKNIQTKLFEKNEKIAKGVTVTTLWARRYKAEKHAYWGSNSVITLYLLVSQGLVSIG
jgi:hypothetical protein